jgi:PAS domain S-box-containing protein
VFTALGKRGYESIKVRVDDESDSMSQIVLDESVVNTLRQSEQRFRIATEAVSGVLWTNDAHGEMLGLQQAWAKFTGQTQEEYSGYGWSKAVHPDDAQPTIDKWQEAVREKRLFAFEHRLLGGDGKYRLCSIRALPGLDENGLVREWVSVHTDTTDDRQTCEALANTDERLRLAFSVARGVGTWDWDVVGNRVYANEGFARIYGVDPAKAAVGVSLEEFTRNIHPKDIARVGEAIEITIRTGEEYREYRLLQPDGSLC